MSEKIILHYFFFWKVLKYVQPNLSEVGGVMLYHEPLLSFGGMLIWNWGKHPKILYLSTYITFIIIINMILIFVSFVSDNHIMQYDACINYIFHCICILGMCWTTYNCKLRLENSKCYVLHPFLLIHVIVQIIFFFLLVALRWSLQM